MNEEILEKSEERASHHDSVEEILKLPIQNKLKNWLRKKGDVA